MRPTRLELAGFGSFREPTVVDLADADLFVLVGPTGAGKSTVIDALTFALYGSVPRYDDRRLVAPVVNQGRVEAKVRLDFTVDDVAYTAVRVVRRTATGATTKEARLERHENGDVRTLAGNEKELTEQVERLLGLSFDHFTRCVVLPQGAFAEFLHARPRERHDLLVELLGIDVYRRIARRARDQAKRAAARAEHLRLRLDGELAHATPEAAAAAQVRVDQLEALRDRVAAVQPELDHLREQGAVLRAVANEARARRDLLDGLTVPDDVAQLSRRLSDAAQGRADAAEALAKAEQQRVAAEQARDALPDGAAVTELQRLVADRDTRAAERDAAARAVEAATAVHHDAVAAHGRAEQDAAEARAALERARRDNLARTLSHGLGPGDDCPVCERPLDEPPDHGDASDLQAAEEAHDAAARQLSDRATALQRAATELARHQAAHESAVTAHDGVAARISQRTSASDVALDGLPRVAAAVEQADRDLRAARRDENAARVALREAEQRHAQLDGDRRRGWTAFDDARDRLATLGPPPVERDDLAAAWAQLTSWVTAQRPTLARAAADAERAVTDAVEQWRARTGELVAACRDADVPLERNDPLPACVAALERARHAHAAVVDAIATAQRLRDEVRADQALTDTATRLGQQLGTNRFEHWLLTQALGQLVADASVRLRQLSSHAYSLEVDDAGGFAVIDHRNADERRSARTLSGGETFLASLALALSLADHVAQLAAGVSARLDALFLDEGFGTLDPDTLDVVAAALEELGAHGRTVGLVTHVRELAERMPVRLEVRRTGETSTVERIDQ